MVSKVHLINTNGWEHCKTTTSKFFASHFLPFLTLLQGRKKLDFYILNIFKLQAKYSFLPQLFFVMMAHLVWQPSYGFKHTFALSYYIHGGWVILMWCWYVNAFWGFSLLFWCSLLVDGEQSPVERDLYIPFKDFFFSVILARNGP